MAEVSIQVSRPLSWRLRHVTEHWYRSHQDSAGVLVIGLFACEVPTAADDDRAREYATGPLFPYICRNLLPSDSAPGWKLRSDIAAFRRGRLFLCKVMQHGP
jgi:hypothetical protein